MIAMIKSTRFIIIQEGIFIGFVACLIYAFKQSFPIIPFLSYLGPIVLGAYGIKSYANFKSNGGETK